MSTVEPKKKGAPEPDPKDQAPKEEKRVIPVDFFYPANHIETVLPDSTISRSCFEFQFHFHFSSFDHLCLF